MKVVAVIPAYNEERTIESVVMKTRNYVDEVVVADDSSHDNTKIKAEQAGAKVITPINIYRGAGVNTYRGIKEALEYYDADIVVTIDGDGQHDAGDIEKLLKPIIQDDADIVIGVRIIEYFRVPHYRRLGLDTINILYNVMSNDKLVDCQCGLRAYKRETLENIMPIEESGFSFSVETLIKARVRKYRIHQVPIMCIYFDKIDHNSTLNPILHGLGVAIGTVKWRIKEEILGGKTND